MRNFILFIVLVLIATKSNAQFNSGDIFETEPTPNCFALSVFELDLTNEQAVELCSSTSPAPAMCYKFLNSAKDLGLNQEQVIDVCAKTKSMTGTIDCVMTEIQQNSLSTEETVEACRTK